MICLSYNCKGLANSDKKLALKRLLHATRIDALFLQETLGDGLSITKILTPLLPDWSFATIDARGRSGGCALGINNKTIRVLNWWGRVGAIGAEVITRELDLPISLINVYGPCLHKETFWDSLLSCTLLQQNNIVLGDDMNFSIGISESWGPQAIPDPLSDYFANQLELAGLLDIEMPKKTPTW